MRKIGRRAKNHAALSERYTLSSLPDNNVGRVAAGDAYFAVRGGGGTLGVVRGGRVVGWIDVGRLHHLDAKAWMRHVGQPVRSTPARSPYAYMNPSRKPIDHKFAGALFSAGHSKTALAYLRGTLTKSTARELAAGKKRR